ncbi:hypothetical protein [Flavimaricola marinus]|uniref:DUF2059 domain-containing protein n=1 Tax=Flavimaricola marinus TaxID=1819565 RepID=A0A238L8S3_9RHOB|nr:hypothetical protein [Flavimaricola marinus]SMY06068.1 hypothetical protein LOM8899_00189 [Flavimaricola marinus]
MKHAHLIAVCLLAGAPAAAQVCDPSPSEVVPNFEAVKQVFLDGVTRESLGPLLSKMSVSDEMWSGMTTGLANYFPGGFTHCTSVVQRRDDPGLVQEIFSLRTEDEARSLFVYLAGFHMDGEVAVMSLSFQTSVREALEQLR